MIESIDKKSAPIIQDIMEKISLITENSNRISERLGKAGYRVGNDIAFDRRSASRRLSNSLSIIFGLNENSWNKYKTGQRQFSQTSLSRFTQFILHLGGERYTHAQISREETDSDLYYKVLNICAGRFDTFEQFFDKILDGAPIRDALKPEKKAAIRIGDITDLSRLGLNGKTLLERLIEIDISVLDDIKADEEGYVDQWTPIFMAHPDTWRLAISGSDEIVGYWHFVPIDETDYTQIISGSMLDSQISASRIKLFEFPGWYDIYFVSFCLLQEYRGYTGIQLLINSLFDHLTQLAEADIYFSRVCAHAYTPYGDALCNDLGMNVVANHFRKGSIYEGRFEAILKSRLLSSQHKLQKLYRIRTR